MKVSVSLSDEDVTFVDSYAEQTGARSRSAVIHQAINMLRTAELEEAYESAWDEWDGSDDARLWDVTTADGVADAPR
ncbi:ribbon-helix-helix domain-containing protein [Saccharopolyspora indica]|uniref:ribbon-helix-helix domain-containing protein n=1 Tax=Saccharopolyspora indica TaxID=1229659 RepID=UPI0022EB987A|nr:ribbon-helix-helix domain-containing protein [Saccharopolyspora indica]MDA3646416.1 ribbon-helix-helix domain-containing protein [Saccharopolyspora indica]